MLTNDIVSFEQLGLDQDVHSLFIKLLDTVKYIDKQKRF